VSTGRMGIHMNFKNFFTTQTWWGKILGAIFGFLTGGPAGAIFGILVGNFFDKGFASHYSNQHWLYFSEKQKAVQKTFFESTFSIMGHIAKADGRVSEEELKIAARLMDELRLNTSQKKQAMRLFNAGKHPQFNMSSILTELKQACHNNRELLRLFIDIQYRAALVDGLSEWKIKLLDNVFTLLGFAPLHNQNRFYEDFDVHFRDNQQNHQSSSTQYEYKTPTPQSQLDKAYALLEVSKDAGKQDVKRAYRRLLNRNHPDKLIAQGLPQEMIALANDKTQKIVKAYGLIAENKGW
jgi:DnaJ like chaperone protein